MWPSSARNVKLAPPKGAEFGKTEVFYLTVRAENHARAVALNEAIFKQLRARFQELRDVKAESMVEELTKTVRLAKADLEQATAALRSAEHRVGADLGELRSMQDLATSDSALRRSGEELRAQLRENATAEKTNRELLAAAADAQADPGRFVAMPNRLLESQASLRRLKDGLVDAQLRTAALLGTMSAEHPRVQAARQTETEIGRNLHNELVAAQRGIEIELQLCATAARCSRSSSRAPTDGSPRWPICGPATRTWWPKPESAASCWNGPKRTLPKPEPAAPAPRRPASLAGSIGLTQALAP